MRTRSKSYPNNSNATIPRRSNRRRVPNIVEPKIRIIEEVIPMVDRTMEELLHAPTEGYGEAIVIPEILAENFEIKMNLLQLVQTNKFHGFERDNPHTHISNFKRMTSTLKYRDVPNDAIKLMLFPYSLEGAARIWYEKEPPNLILTWDDLTFGEAWERFKEMLRAYPHHGFSKLTQIDTLYNGLNEQDQDSLNAAAGGNILSKTTREALKIIENKSKVRYSRSKSNVSRVNTNYRESSSKTDDRIDKLADQISNLVEIVNKQVITPASAKAVEKTCVICGGAHAYYDCIATDSNHHSVCVVTASTSGTLPSNIVPNPKGEMKVVTTRSGLAYEGPSIPTNSPIEKVVKRETEETMDKEHPNCQGGTAHIQPPSLLTNKDKLFELAKVPLNENCSAMLLKKLPKKLRDPGKFLIPCDFPGIDVCHALADLGASINLMPLSIWKKLSLPELTPTQMTLELADRSITRPKGVAEDVFVKVRKFHFPTDFVVVDYEADPRVSLILGRSFLRTGRAIIAVYGEEITLRVNDESVTFNLYKTMRYSLTYDDNSVNRVDVIDIACEEFVQDLLDFQYNSKSSNPTLVSNPLFSEETKSEFCKEPIVKSSSPTLTPFGESDFFLEEIKDFLKDESTLIGIKDSFYDPEGDILYLEKLLNDDPSQLPLMDLKQAEETKAKSSIEEPSKLELKELPSHLEYDFLEETDKLPIIIAKDLKDVEKEALSKVLKSHKRAIAWKIFDIKGHKILKSIIEVDREKVDVIAKLPHPTTVKGVRSFLGHAVVPDWNLPFELMCDASNFAIGAVLGQRKTKHFQPIHYAIKTTTEAQIHYTTTEKEMLAVVYAFEKFRPYLVLSKSIVYTDHSAPKYLLSKQDAKPRLLRWVEAKALPTNDARVIAKFLKSPFSRFGTPMAIISDRGIHFCNDQFARVMTKYGVTHRLATTYHPQTSGQVEVSNRGLKYNFERTVGENRASWSDKLDDALWAYENSLIYKERTKKLHDSKIKNRIFNVGDQVLLFNSRLKIFSRKLKTRWLGPFTITQVFPYGTVELSQPNGSNFKVNGHRVKHYFGGDIPLRVVPDLYTIPMNK
uniref:Reverse transcriptase domain-containing protein n=1 Tax=Tanacetum cinerariifolium TaxID=118510 RepID=A0A6L2N973_TANCI|nr:reverse transcriptase domain-containing protein [Tanacetum cinerariifolium]